MHLSDVDLNLLVYLDSLLAECHVTNAARRVGLSQSAMSRALSRLRDLFGDELLVKTAQGMTPTPLALRLAPEVRRILRSVERTVTREDSFDPDIDLRRVTIVADSAAQSIILAPFLIDIATDAPGLTLDIRPCHQEWPRRALASGEVDLYVGALPESSMGMRTEEIVRTSLVCLSRHDIEASRDIGRFLDIAHVDVDVAPLFAGVIDAALRGVGRRRTLSHKFTDLSSAASFISQTKTLALVPDLMIEAALPHFEQRGLKKSTPPIALPALRLGIAFHVRAEEDAALMWMRSRFHELFRSR